MFLLFCCKLYVYFIGTTQGLPFTRILLIISLPISSKSESIFGKYKLPSIDDGKPFNDFNDLQPEQSKSLYILFGTPSSDSNLIQSEQLNSPDKYFGEPSNVVNESQYLQKNRRQFSQEHLPTLLMNHTQYNKNHQTLNAAHLLEF